MIPITCCGMDGFIWQADFNGSDYGYEDSEVEFISTYMCPRCGRMIEVIRWALENEDE